MFSVLSTISLAIPFIGVLLSIALFPLFASSFWHRFEKLVLLFWGAAGLIVMWNLFPMPVLIHSLTHTMWSEYIPFIAVLFALFTIAGGIHLDLSIKNTSLNNVFFLIVASFFASFIGTTGASILFIRPLLRINENRLYKTHTVIFFIFMVSNAAGCLTPLGDPPLFMGYLLGVPFLWPLQNLWKPFLGVFSMLLFIYWIIDCYFMKKELSSSVIDINASLCSSVRIDGKRNMILLLVLIVTLLITPFLPIAEITAFGGVSITVADCLRLGVMVFLGWLSYVITPSGIHRKQHFNFTPVYEVARIFLCIFITLIPLNHVLSGDKNVFASLLTMNMGVSPQCLYFWLSGIFSGFLDNTPTYLVFFKLAGGNIAELTTVQKPILIAISLGSVLMGALTYIGNAPNFMVLSIANQHKIKMPSFLGYMVWSFIILIPIFLVMSYLWL